MDDDIPFKMFELKWSDEELKRLTKAESLYHRGQAQVWDGKQVLTDLIAKHGTPRFSAETSHAVSKVVGQLMWGELAAWRTAAQLANELVPLEAKMAATAQAHDEARHFYVFHDYLMRAGCAVPREVSFSARRLLRMALRSGSHEKKILAMQLQIEATALTIFHSLREAKVCPVLSELLVYIEKDEARHVGLGVQYLPLVLRGASLPKVVDLALHSATLVLVALATQLQGQRHLRTLGIESRDVSLLARAKHKLVFDQLLAGLGAQETWSDIVDRVIDVVRETLWPPPEKSSARGRLLHVVRTMQGGAPRRVTTTLEPESPSVTASSTYFA
jgi:hypothetical protein